MCLRINANGTNAGVGCSGSHYHFTEKEDGAPVPPLLVGSLLGDLTQRWETVGRPVRVRASVYG